MSKVEVLSGGLDFRTLNDREVDKMVDWDAALTVAVSGVLSVFAVLIILQISVQVTGWVVSSLDKKNQERPKATS